MSMEKKLDLVKILKNCPRGTKLYSCIHGEVEFIRIDNDKWYPIITHSPAREAFTSDGRYFDDYPGECLLFPSKDNRDWSTFVAPKKKIERFDPYTLKPFDHVLVRDKYPGVWTPQILSYVDGVGNFVDMSGTDWKQAIPYEGNERLALCCDSPKDEFFRYWEDEDGQEDA